MGSDPVSGWIESCPVVPLRNGVAVGEVGQCSESECRAADWYQIGFRDGLTGMQRMDAAYETQCGKQGLRPDVAAYARGWQEGLWEFDSRKAHGGEE